MKSKPKTSKTSTIKPVSINWKLWLGMDKINKFQAIGLTIPIPPEQIKVKLRRNNFYAELQNVDQKYVEEYELRVQQFQANTSFSHFDDFTDEVIFREFALWVNTYTDWAIPAELMEFTKKLKAAPQSIAKNSDNIIIGGIYGRSIWGTLEIKTFVVRDEFRKSGIGTTLIKEAELEAKRRNCEYISLDTFSFQAPEFYEKMGFMKIGTETDFPKGFDKIYYRKKI